MDLEALRISLTPTLIQKRLRKLIFMLRMKRLWIYIDHPTRAWLELASRLRGIKFRSKKVLSVLMSILARLKPLLRLRSFFRLIGLTKAWKNSALAESWGNVSARAWRSDPAYQFYCGLVEVQVSRIIPSPAPFMAILPPPIRSLVARTLWRVT